VQRAFGEAYIKDVNDGVEASNSESLLEEYGVTQAMIDSGAGGELITDWLNSGMDGDGLQIELDEDPMFGQAGISEIRFMNKEYPDATSLSYAPIIDILFEDFNNEPINEKYTFENAKADTVIVNGKEYNQGEMFDVYVANGKRGQTEYGKLDKDGKDAFPDLMNKDDFLRAFTEYERTEGGGLQGFRDKLRGVKTIETAEGEEDIVLVVKEDYMGSDGQQHTKGDFWDNLNEEQTSNLENVLETGGVNSMDSNSLKNLIFRSGGDEKTQDADSFVVKELMDQGGLGEIDPTTSLKDGIFREEGTPYSAGTIQETMRDMNYNAGANRYEGYTMYEGMPYQVILTPSHSERNGGDLSDPMIGVKLKPLGHGTEDNEVNMKVRLEGSPVVKDSAVKAPASRVSMERAERWFREFGGNV